MKPAIFVMEKLWFWPIILFDKIKSKLLRWLLIIPAFIFVIISMAVFGIPFLILLIGGCFYEIVNDKE